jgi:hypothetical protein
LELWLSPVVKVYRGQIPPEWLRTGLKGPRCPQLAPTISKLEPWVILNVEEMLLNFLLNKWHSYSVLLLNPGPLPTTGISEKPLTK